MSLSAVVLAVATFSSCTPTPSGGSGGGGVTVDGPGTLVAPAIARLPYAEVGSTPAEVGSTPQTTLTIEADGAVDGFDVLVSGPFTVTGLRHALADGQTRDLTVSYAGSSSTPANAVGTLTLRSDAGDVTVRLGAVVGAADLPHGTLWDDDGYGLHATVALPSAPFPASSGSWTNDSVYLWIPHGLDDGYGVVTHLHGHYAVLEDMLESKDLPAQFRFADRNAIYIVPQGPVNAASGDFGKLMQAGGHARLVRDAVALLYREGLVQLPETNTQVVTTHSGGYRAAARIVEQGGLQIDAVHLFDALYGESATFEDFAVEGGILRSIHTPTGGTRANNLALKATLEGEGFVVGDNPLTSGAEGYEVTIAPTSAAHGVVMAFQSVYGRWLQHSGLPAL